MDKKVMADGRKKASLIIRANRNKKKSVPLSKGLKIDEQFC